MDHQEAVKRASDLAYSKVKNRSDTETKYKELNELFKAFNLTWIELERME